MKEVRSIPYEQARSWFTQKHYAHRIPSVSFAFALYIDGIMRGVVSYGTPASSSLLKGVCGKEHASKVLELNRLIIEEDCPKNSASFLVGRSLRLLPKPSIVVSYADTAQGHVGYIYQACNFLYTGLSAKRTDWKIKGQEEKHGATIADKSRGMKNRAQYMRDTYGDDFYLEERSRKHRYIYFCGAEHERKALLYPVEPYPKGETHRYDAGENLPTQLLLI